MQRRTTRDTGSYEGVGTRKLPNRSCRTNVCRVTARGLSRRSNAISMGAPTISGCVRLTLAPTMWTPAPAATDTSSW